MGTFNTRTTLEGKPSLIPLIADRICEYFSSDGYEINREDLISGSVDISITKGGLFKSIVGMKTALKITLVPKTESIDFEAGVGIFGQQALPTVISMLFFWPVLLTQIWGLIKQSDLDDKALAIAQTVIDESSGCDAMQPKFCTKCGSQFPSDSNFCTNCGSPLT